MAAHVYQRQRSPQRRRHQAARHDNASSSSVFSCPNSAYRNGEQNSRVASLQRERRRASVPRPQQVDDVVVSLRIPYTRKLSMLGTCWRLCIWIWLRRRWSRVNRRQTKASAVRQQLAFLTVEDDYLDRKQHFGFGSDFHWVLRIGYI